MNQHFARIVDGIVAEIWVSPSPDVTPAEAFHPDFPGIWMACAIDVEPGFVLDGGGALVPPPVVSLSKAELEDYLADRRWQAEQGGAFWRGWPIHTDDRSQGKYLSELQAIALNVRVDNDPWKFADGEFRPVSNADFPELAIAARDHVRNMFGIEALVLAEIEAGTVTTRQQIDAAFA